MTVNPKIFNIALIGCGAVSEYYYLPALQLLENKKIACLKSAFDPDPKRLALFEKAFPSFIPAESLSKLNELDIDLAIVASPVKYHAQQAIDILRAKIGVLCEKPMADNTREAEAMIMQARGSNSVLAVGLFRRFFPAIQVIKDIISAEILGEVVSFDFREGSIFNWPAQSDSFFRKDIAGGGVLMDIGVHALDLLIWWLGEPKEFSCEDDAAGGVEANCCIKLKFEKGFEGSIRLSRDCLLANRYFIKCEKGWLGWNVGDANSIELGFHKTKFVLNGLVCNQMERYGLPSAGSVSPTYQQSFIYQLIDVIEAVKNRRKPFVCGEEGIRSLKLIEACYKNSKLMDMPWLSREEAEATMALRTKNNE